jgi:Zn ribbon nucleic-acid-binding protein
MEITRFFKVEPVKCVNCGKEKSMIEISTTLPINVNFRVFFKISFSINVSSVVQYCPSCGFQKTKILQIGF